MENKEDKRIYTLSSEAPFKAVVKMSVPLIFGMFIMVLYNLVDTDFIGLTGDDYQMAAVNLAYPVMMVSVAISNIIGTGASSFIARCLGLGEKNKAEHTLTSAFTLTVINSLLVMVIGLVFLSPLVRLLGAKENTFLYNTAVCSGNTGRKYFYDGQLYNRRSAQERRLCQILHNRYDRGNYYEYCS